MSRLMSTKEVAAYLGVNEKMVYTLIAEKGLPATKITGKWLFPGHLVEQWVESRTINFPDTNRHREKHPDLLIVAGSNDILFDRAMALFMELHPQRLVTFSNLGSMGGLRALRRGVCHMATSHLLEENEKEYNFSYAASELDRMPAVLNFCLREQGLVVPRSNPKKIAGINDLGSGKVTVVNRALGTGTRQMFDREMDKASLKKEQVKGYDRIVQRHLDVGLEVLSGRADAGPAIRTVASLLDLDFIPLHRERFDLIVPKHLFFDQVVQEFFGTLSHERFARLADDLEGYDLSLTGTMIYPGQIPQPT